MLPTFASYWHSNQYWHSKQQKTTGYTDNELPAGEITKLWKRYDKTEYYPGFMLSAEASVAVGPWIKALAELQGIEAFGGVYDAYIEIYEENERTPTCKPENVIVVE